MGAIEMLKKTPLTDCPLKVFIIITNKAVICSKEDITRVCARFYLNCYREEEENRGIAVITNCKSTSHFS